LGAFGPAASAAPINAFVLFVSVLQTETEKRNRVELLDILYNDFVRPKRKDPELLVGIGYGINDLLDDIVGSRLCGYNRTL
jgi:hypothetical protein